jgi:uncharacterized protein
MSDTALPHDILHFPCRFPLKLIGLNNDGFLEDMVLLVGRHVPPDDQEEVTTRPSHEGRYISITINFTARSRKQVDDLYLEISTDKRVLYAL